MPVGSLRIPQQIVAVVPHDDQAQVLLRIAEGQLLGPQRLHTGHARVAIRKIVDSFASLRVLVVGEVIGVGKIWDIFAGHGVTENVQSPGTGVTSMSTM